MNFCNINLNDCRIITKCKLSVIEIGVVVKSFEFIVFHNNNNTSLKMFKQLGRTKITLSFDD
jgi:hypothetical protein